MISYNNLVDVDTMSLVQASMLLQDMVNKFGLSTVVGCLASIADHKGHHLQNVGGSEQAAGRAWCRDAQKLDKLKLES